MGHVGSEIIRVPEAARILGVTPQFLRKQIRTGNWKFGERIQGDERDTYVIYKTRLERWRHEQN